MKKEYKNYYDILGVAKTATKEEIKSAYRKLAKQYHPDKTGGDKVSEQKFKDAAEAYDVLSSDTKRSDFDNPKSYYAGFSGSFNYSDIDSMFGTFFGDTYNSRKAVPKDIRVKVSIQMKEAYNGCRKEIKIERNIYCTDCKGSGKVELLSSKGKKCFSCKGTGKVPSFIGEVRCRACGGTGNGSLAPCEKCKGKGSNRETVSIAINIPPKTAMGSVFRVAGQGNVNGVGNPGNVEVEIVYPSKEDLYSIDPYGNITFTIEASWADALLDKEKQIYIFGSEMYLKLDGRRKDGSIYSIFGKGMSGKDILVKVVYVLPENMDEEDKKNIAKILKKYDHTKTRT